MTNDLCIYEHDKGTHLTLFNLYKITKLNHPLLIIFYSLGKYYLL